MRHHISRRPMPVEHSILWKPFHDSHYVVASLQPSDGDRRKIFVRQQVIARVEALVRAHGRRTVGLLLGQLYQCSVTGVDYLVVESISEHASAADETEMADAVSDAVATWTAEHQHPHVLASAEDRAQVLGWYRGVPNVEAKPSLATAAIHVSLFGQPWQTTLLVGESSSPGGALLLHDTVNSRWFFAPFYELLSHAADLNQPMPTLIKWPQYLTAQPVMLTAQEVTRVTDLAEVRTRKTAYERPWLLRKVSKENPARRHQALDIDDVSASRPADLSMPELPPISAPPAASPPATHATKTPTVDETATTSGAPSSERPVSDRPVPQQVHSGLADLVKPKGTKGRPSLLRSREEKLSIVDDRDQRVTASNSQRIGDDDDTRRGDDVAQYIEIARVEGFFVAGRFHSTGQLSRDETLWVLNEPYSGMLLAVTGTGSKVVSAMLHYNLQTDEAGLKLAPFPEHRDPESRTIYVRETCIDSLRARCRRLRATNALLREWKVTPAISFLTPGEWESLPGAGVGAEAAAHVVADLNRSRIAELPAGVRSQFHLGSGDEAPA